MVVLYVAGERAGTLADAATVIPDAIARNEPVEFRDEAGEPVGRFIPVRPPTPAEPLVPWEPGVTREELDRRAAEPGLTFEELRKRLGWA